jgi:hypothetical protein
LEEKSAAALSRRMSVIVSGKTPSVGKKMKKRIRKMCEDCAVKQPAFGLPPDRTKRWCSGCAKGHAGAVDFKNKTCEDCAVKQPAFGLPPDRTRRWCSGCAKGHAGAVDARHMKRKTK